MSEDLHAEIAHHSLAEETGQPGFAVRTDELPGECKEEHNGCLPYHRVIVAREGDIDDALSKDWPDELEHALEAKEEQGAGDQQSVWAYICKQTTHQAAVVCFAECFLLVVRVGMGHSVVC